MFSCCELNINAALAHVFRRHSDGALTNYIITNTITSFARCAWQCFTHKPSHRQTSALHVSVESRPPTARQHSTGHQCPSLFSLTFTASVGANTKPVAPEHRAAVVADAVAMNIEAFMVYWEAGQSTALLAQRAGSRCNGGESSPVDNILIISIQTLCLIL